MKRTRKRIFGILMTALMVCLPAMQALAQSFDASVMDPVPILFPGDALEGITTPVTLDGEPLALGEELPTSWVNENGSKVYRTDLAEDGSLALTLAGYELNVEGGTSSAGDEGTGKIGGHYVNADGSVDTAEGEPTKDRAYYPAGTVVKLKADEPKEGMEFDNWTVETSSGSVAVDVETDSETTMTMPEEKVKVTANYRAAETEAPADEGAEGAPEGEPVPEGQDGMDMGAVPEGQDGVDMGAVPEGQDGMDMEVVPEGQDGMDMEVVPEGQDGVDLGMAPEGQDGVDLEIDPDGQIVVDNIGVTPEEQAPADEGAPQDITVDPGEGDGADDSILAGVDENAIDIMIGDDYTEFGEIANAPESVPAPEENNAIRYMLSVNYGTVTVENEDGAEGYAAGTPITVTANDYTANGCYFSNWTVGPQNAELFLEDSTSATVTFAMPEGETILTAQYVDAAGIPVADPTVAIVSGDTAGSADGEPQPEDQQQAEPQPEDQQQAEPQPEGQQQAEPQPEDQQQAEPQPEDQQQAAPQQGDQDTQTVDNPVYGEEGDGGSNGAGESVTLYPVTIANNSGTITKTGETIPEAPQASAQVAAGTAVTVTANPVPEGQQFAGWTWTASAGPIITEGSANDMTFTFTMPAEAVTLEATYGAIPTPPPAPATYLVRTTNGSINGNGAELTVEGGATVTITANPAPAGQVFSEWVVREGSYDLGTGRTSETVQVSVAQNLTFEATYKPIEYTVTVNSGSASAAKAAGGTAVTITAGKAPKGMEFDYWSVDSGNASLADADSASTTFTMPAANVTVTANYRLKEYYVTVQNGYADAEAYYQGDKVTIYSNYPSSGKVFDKWVVVDGKASFEDASRWKTTFTMPAKDVTVNATYKDGPSPESNQIQELTAGGEYITDSTIRFTAVGAGMDNTNPNPGDYRYRPTGYQIGNVTGSWQAAPYTTSMSIKARGDYTLKVNYSKDVFDGSNWVADGTIDTRSVTFRVLTPAEAVATGDETPIALMVTLAGVSCLTFLLLLGVFIRRRSRG